MVKMASNSTQIRLHKMGFDIFHEREGLIDKQPWEKLWEEHEKIQNEKPPGRDVTILDAYSYQQRKSRELKQCVSDLWELVWRIRK